MKCQKCGYPLPEDSEFCQYCDTRLEPQQPSDISSENIATPGEVIAPVEVAAPVETPACNSVSEVASEPVPQPEVVQEASLFHRAYVSYLSKDPEERRFFEDLLGSEELKEAYLQECDRNQKDYDNGVRVSFKQSYTEFMAMLRGVYLGTPSSPSVSYEKPKPGPPPVAPTTPAAPVPTPESTKIPDTDGKHAFCKNCGAAIDPVTKKCSGCGKQYFNAKKTVPIVLLSLLLLVSVGLNVMQYLQGKEAVETVKTQTTKIEKLEEDVSSQKKTISSQRSQIASLKKKGDYFDTLCKELSSGNIGYAANNFKASESVIIVDKNETNRKFTLTANWTNGGTVSVDYSGSAAWVDFDTNSWATSTKMSIEPWKEGVTAVTFSNDVDSRTFKVIIIVTE